VSVRGINESKCVGRRRRGVVSLNFCKLMDR
jgi:hypothetical protein